MAETETRTTCPYCGVGCGVIARRDGLGTVSVAGDKNHPANFGRLCSKGSALAETIGLEGRLLTPLIDGRKASWDTALDLVADTFKSTIAAHGPDSVAFYVSGQCLTEDYYVANKLMKGFIGSGNIDTNSRLCMASSVAGHKRAFGADTVPGVYEDLELADLVVLVGSNLAWCHPVIYQRLAAAREKRGIKVVLVDPRRTNTADIADLHLPLAPGSDVALFSGLLTYLAENGHLDETYIGSYTSGFTETLTSAIGLDETAEITGVDASLLRRFYELFAACQRTVTVYSQGVNQSSAGTDKVNAIINCHLATGRIGRPGMGPFSITGQPNAMGGREVGGLANMLAAHMELGDSRHASIVKKAWGTKTLASKPGLKAVDLFRAVADGRIKALWIMSTNPVDSLPEADSIRSALDACPFVVVSEVVRHTDTTAHADVLLPAAAWGEKDGTVTNSERRISRQRAFMPAPGMAKPDWWQMAEVGRRMGFAEAFSYDGPADVFAEYAALSAAGNKGSRDFDIGAYAKTTTAEYDALTPFLWPQAPGQERKDTRFFAEGNFYTADGKGRFIPVTWRPAVTRVSAQYPLILNTGRIRDQWHTMTRTAKTPRLLGHIAEPFVELHPDDAATYGIAAADLVRVASPHGSAVVRAVVTDRQLKGSVFVPMHWTGQYSSQGRVDVLVPAVTDPVSGQPELKHAAVSVRRFSARWYGFAVSINPISTEGLDYWALALSRSGYRLELAGLDAPEDWRAMAEQLLGFDSQTDVLAYHDRQAGHHRFAVFDGEQLVSALFIAPEPVSASRSYLSDLTGDFIADASTRLRVLAGRPCSDGGAKDRGAVVCACFDVGVNQITGAIKGGCCSIDAVGEALRAGTNCGSCRPEIGRLIAQVMKPGEAVAAE